MTFDPTEPEISKELHQSKAPKIVADRRELARDMKRRGLSIRFIAKTLNLKSRQSVYRYLQDM